VWVALKRPMERHRLFNLETSLSLMGLELDDWVIIIGSWTLTLQIAGLLLAPRPRLLIATLVAGAGFLLYRRLKDRVPKKFGWHLLTYLTEADTYRAVADTHNLQPIVAPRPSTRRGVGEHAVHTR